MSASRLLFGSTVFLASFLLFLVEPIAAKQLLPIFGGSAAVWITCLVFFQTALLVAYLYAHWLAERSRWLLHFALLILATASAIAWTIQTINVNSTHPIASIFWALSSPSGFPFSCSAQPARCCRCGLPGLRRAEFRIAFLRCRTWLLCLPSRSIQPPSNRTSRSRRSVSCGVAGSLPFRSFREH